MARAVLIRGSRLVKAAILPKTVRKMFFAANDKKYKRCASIQFTLLPSSIFQLIPANRAFNFRINSGFFVNIPEFTG